MTLVIILGIVFFLTGFYLVLAAILDWHKDHVPRKFLARMVKESMSPLSYRYFRGIFGGVIILIVLSLVFVEFVKPKVSKNQTNSVTVKYIETPDNLPFAPGFSGEKSGGTSITTVISTSEKIQSRLAHEYHLFDSISFKDNYMNEFPEFLLEMENLEVINFTNNDLEQIPVSKLKELKSLRKLILVNNPIDSLNLIQLNQELDIQILQVSDEK